MRGYFRKSSGRDCHYGFEGSNYSLLRDRVKVTLCKATRRESEAARRWYFRISRVVIVAVSLKALFTSSFRVRVRDTCCRVTGSGYRFGFWGEMVVQKELNILIGILSLKAASSSFELGLGVLCAWLQDGNCRWRGYDISEDVRSWFSQCPWSSLYPSPFETGLGLLYVGYRFGFWRGICTGGCQGARLVVATVRRKLHSFSPSR